MTVQTEPAPTITPVSVAPASLAWYYLLFFLSGIPALLYQIVWQRALFTIYGVNIESVTVIVTVFMLGLGLGSLAGGRLSRRRGIPLLAVFGVIELSIGAYGAVSLPAFHSVASSTAGASALGTGVVTFALLLVPTLLMGCTLPLLVAHLVRRSGNVGESVGVLYSVNTLGSAAACFLAANFLMGWLGESGCVRLAALLNTSVAIAAFALHFRGRREPFQTPATDSAAPLSHAAALPFYGALLLAALVGFLSLGYEIVWYRIYSFVSGRTASSFASLLGWFLAGIAYGSLVVRDLCRGRLRSDSIALRRSLASTVIWANVAAFLVAPALAITIGFNLVFPFVFVGAALLGASFPLISHASIDPHDRHAGTKVSYLYLANILGCASGSLCVGFFLMDRLSTKGISIALLVIGLLLGGALSWTARLPLNGRRLAGFAAALMAIVFSWHLYSTVFERLLFKTTYSAAKTFANLVESRAGVIAITPAGQVFGGGVYDGYVSTNLVNDVNGIFRAYAVDALHPNPKEVLIVGLSLGAWAQVIANDPRVARVTIVEIDAGYLKIIPRYPAVASLLRNPKVEIVIDDGRRWLVRNRARTFDLIVMNTSQHWLAHVSNLLSVEYLRLIREHLRPGGVHYYNTTFSVRALFTGASVYPYALRVGNFLAVSDSPIVFDKDRWRAALSDYKIDGRPVFDLADQAQQSRLREVLSIAETQTDKDATKGMRIESRGSILARFAGERMITDDNMGSEWGPAPAH
jgi:spermidine synthase